jgi:hypothetical protein
MVPLVVYVDVDDTLIRTSGSKRIPVSGVVESVAVGLGIAELFAGFLPKPQVLVDDRALAQWNRLIEIHPSECGQWNAEDYQRAVAGDLKLNGPC